MVHSPATAKLTAHHAPKTSSTGIIKPPIPQARTAKNNPAIAFLEPRASRTEPEMLTECTASIAATFQRG